MRWDSSLKFAPLLQQNMQELDALNERLLMQLNMQDSDNSALDSNVADRSAVSEESLLISTAWQDDEPLPASTNALPGQQAGMQHAAEMSEGLFHGEFSTLELSQSISDVSVSEESDEDDVGFAGLATAQSELQIEKFEQPQELAPVSSSRGRSVVSELDLRAQRMASIMKGGK